MIFIKTNLKNFSSYTLTSFFYNVQPVRIWFNKNVILIEAKNRPFSFDKGSYTFVKNPDFSKYQRVYHKVINQNYYVVGWNYHMSKGLKE